MDDPPALIAALDGLPEVERVLSAGTDKSSIVLGAGLQVDLMVCPPAAWGTHLVHFTGNKEHNVALRGMALDRGCSLSEKGFKVVEAGELLLDAEEAASMPASTCPGSRRSCARTADVLEVARKGPLPELVTRRWRPRATPTYTRTGPMAWTRSRSWRALRATSGTSAWC